MKVYTIGVGVRGLPFCQGRKGKIHVMMLNVDVDEKTLQAVASETGGAVLSRHRYRIRWKIYEQINRYEKSAQSVQKFEHVEDLYRWTLYPALGLPGTRSSLAANDVSQVTVSSTATLAAGGLLTACPRCSS